jgi:hypothetical protein
MAFSSSSDPPCRAARDQRARRTTGKTPSGSHGLTAVARTTKDPDQPGVSKGTSDVGGFPARS